MFRTSQTIESTCPCSLAHQFFWYWAELCPDWETRVLRSDEDGVLRARHFKLVFRILGRPSFPSKGCWLVKFSLVFCYWASASRVCYARSGHFLVTCVGLYQMPQRNKRIKAIVDELLGLKSWYDACLLGRLMCSTDDDFGRLRVMRVKELIVSVLTLFKLGWLIHSLRVYNFFDLFLYWLFCEKFSDSSFISKGDLAWNLISVKSALGWASQ